MNIFQLVAKQMRQRALSTWLTLLSVMLGVALVVAILILRREGNALFGQTDYGYDVLVGVKGSPLQLTMNTVYHLDKSPGNIKYEMYEDLLRLPAYRRYVKMAVPMCVGDSYKGQRIVATTPKFFGYNDDDTRADPDHRFEYRPGKSFEVAEGKMFHPEKFEAVLGSEVTRLTGLKLGDHFQATHGMPNPGEVPDIHKEVWQVVGVMKQTHTANDKCVFIPLLSFYTIAEHAKAEIQREAIRRGENPATQMSKVDEDDDNIKHYTLNADGTINLDVPKQDREISAILVRSRGEGGFAGQALAYNLNLQPDVMAVNPASVMREFFDTFLTSSAQVLLLIALLVTIVAAASIMTTIYNSVAARRREIAILRALGATKYRILTLICVEAALVGLLGGVLGFIAGHLLGAGGSVYMTQLVGEGINWTAVGHEEWIYLVAVVLLAAVAGLVPGLKAYRTPVATNLVAA
ncbi:MAG TPA: ABC transporter permease [Tepidisphaeraceae bacterium]|jgi:putative ABC transport system permease protein